MAAAIIVLALLLGAAGTFRLVKLLGAAAAIIVTILITSVLPLALIEGFWPFNPNNDPQCGFTPDPNLLVFAATLLFPVVAISSLFAVLIVRRRRGS
ncbi:MAG TPA: hypothetical protein VNS11_06265, partial [Sphingomicrobium sp.]|nr:hypothetical protein [Sphingomicrobium sp.]